MMILRLKSVFTYMSRWFISNIKLELRNCYEEIVFTLYTDSLLVLFLIEIILLGTRTRNIMIQKDDGAKISRREVTRHERGKS